MIAIALTGLATCLLISSISLTLAHCFGRYMDFIERKEFSIPLEFDDKGLRKDVDELKTQVAGLMLKEGFRLK